MTETQWLNHFGRNLEIIMDEHGYNQRELAYVSGLSESSISNYIHGKRLPSIQAIINLSYVLGCDLNEFLDFGETITS